MIRYTERKYEFKFDNPYDFIRILISFMFMSPFRLFNEISKKIVFVGKYTLERIILYSIVINTGLIVVNLLSSLVVTGRINILGGSTPLLSLLLSLGLCIGIYLYISKSTSKIFTDCMDFSIVPVEEETPIEEIVEVKEEMTPSNLDDIEIDLDEMIEKETYSSEMKKAVNFVSESRKSYIREDEFIDVGNQLNKAVETNGSELDDLLSRFMSGDNLSISQDFEESESYSQSLYLHDTP